LPMTSSAPSLVYKLSSEAMLPLSLTVQATVALDHDPPMLAQSRVL